MHDRYFIFLEFLFNSSSSSMNSKYFHYTVKRNLMSPKITLMCNIMQVFQGVCYKHTFLHT